MSKVDKNKQINNDTGGDTDVLRASDVIPRPSTSRANPIPIKEIPAKKPAVEIPKFNLAKEIMVEQRKTTATRRKGPGGKTKVEKVKPQSKPVSYAVGQLMLSSPEQNCIIAEIVARDIERLYRDRPVA